MISVAESAKSKRCGRCGAQMQLVSRVRKAAGTVRFFRCDGCRDLAIETELGDAAGDRNDGVARG
jgi:hypothetical protein